MKTIAELTAIRDKVRGNIEQRREGAAYLVAVGMGTCGITAGARDVMTALLAAAESNNVFAKITQTGCGGSCQLEPIVTVTDPTGNKTKYVNMTADKIKAVVETHIMGGKVVTEYTS